MGPTPSCSPPEPARKRGGAQSDDGPRWGHQAASGSDGVWCRALRHGERLGVENPPSGDEVFEVYLRAKAAADAAVEASDLDWTILRPGGLTDDAGTGKVRIETTPFSEPVPRDDVAAVIAGLLADGRGSRRILYLSSGSASIGDALDELLG